MRAVAVSLAAMAALPALAGCLGSLGPHASSGPPVTSKESELMVYRSDGTTATLVKLPASFGGGFQASTVATGYFGAEPSVGVVSRGWAFAEAFEDVVRSKDAGKTWQSVHKAPGGQDFDPMLWVDPATDRIFSTHINPQKTCRTIAISDDDGDTWQDLPMVCPPSSLAEVDHQKLATGRFVGPAAPAGGKVYQSLVSLCYNDLGSTHCAMSYDGGVSFLHDSQVDGLPTAGTPLSQFTNALSGTVGDCGGLNGHQHHGGDGTIYVPYGYECSESRVAFSTDGGATWTRRNPQQGQLELDPSISTTPDGTAYYLYRGEDQRMHLLRSHDRFGTVEGPYLVSPPPVLSTVFAGLVAGSDGRLGYAFLGTPDSSAGPDDAGPTTKWNLYVGESLDADTDAPTFVTARVNPIADPVQRGSICVQLPCRHDDRNLLDFIDVEKGPDGRIWVAYTDGCTSAECKKAGQTDVKTSRDDTLAIAWVSAGPSLEAGHARLKA